MTIPNSIFCNTSVYLSSTLIMFFRKHNIKLNRLPMRAERNGGPINPSFVIQGTLSFFSMLSSLCVIFFSDRDRNAARIVRRGVSDQTFPKNRDFLGVCSSPLFACLIKPPLHVVSFQQPEQISPMY